MNINAFISYTHTHTRTKRTEWEIHWSVLGPNIRFRRKRAIFIRRTHRLRTSEHASFTANLLFVCPAGRGWDVVARNQISTVPFTTRCAKTSSLTSSLIETNDIQDLCTYRWVRMFVCAVAFWCLCLFMSPRPHWSMCVSLCWLRILTHNFLNYLSRKYSSRIYSRDSRHIFIR